MLGILIGVFTLSVVGSPQTLAAPEIFKEACPQGSKSPICKETKNANAKTNTFIDNIISTLLFALGAISVIVIIVGGIVYATSNGDSNKVTQAKNIILYAVVGLVVAILATVIVAFVVERL